MKYVITGGAGNISKPLTEKLLKAGHDVTVISRNMENIRSLMGLGAKPAIGSVNDIAFLIKTFTGADALYTMVPPNYATNDMKASIAEVGKNYTEALKATTVKYVVNLSSVGAHLPDGAGPVSGLYRVEQAMNELKNINIKHLRPTYFYGNFLGNIAMVKNMNIIGGNFGGTGFKLLLSDTNDIADVAFEELSTLNFTGHSFRYIGSDERSTDDIAKVLGDAVGKPQLPWIIFSDENAFAGMVEMRVPENVAKNYVEMGHAVHTGILFEDYWKNHPAKLGKTKLEEFAKTFAAVYNSN
ncbi:MAG TPA: NAD(P)H-binding protein [Chitinophagaceae bacterium]|nr:NAD(P)H-binding protein [Chitinophagaceae bacterium]